MSTGWTTLVEAAALQQALQRARVVDARALASTIRVVDTRVSLTDPSDGAAQYAAGHIPGAIHADLNRDLSDLSRSGHGRHPLPSSTAFAQTLGRWGIMPDTQVVVYDAGDGSMAAARLWWMLRLMGHRAVAVLDGGLAAWLAAGGALSTDPVEVASQPPYPGSFDEAAIVTAEHVLARVSQAGTALIDARAEPRFRGEVEPIDPVAGHVPGALNRPLSLNLRDGRFKPAAELREEFLALLGATSSTETVLMCGSGVTACHLLLAMEVAGLPGARVYADSWSGWISDPTRPVAHG